MGVFKAVLFMLVLAAAGAGKAMAQQSEVIASISIDEVSEILDSFGWQPEILTDDDGGRIDLIMIKVGEITSFVRMMECSDAIRRRCHSFLLYANWDLGGRINENFATLLNQYNDGTPVGRAYYISKPDQAADQMGIDLHVRLHGGVTIAHVRQEAMLWEDVINQFMAMFRQE